MPLNDRERFSARPALARVLRPLGFALFGPLVAAAATGTPPAGPGDSRPQPAALVLNRDWQLQDIAQVSESGNTLSSLGFQPVGWHPATVPGTVLTSLVNDGIYPEPLYGENNRPDRIPESLCRTSYWYRTVIAVPTAYAGRRIHLNFDGINYTAVVWVNGRLLGDVRGAFVRGSFDVTRLVRPGELAALAILIRPPPHPGEPAEQTQAAGTGPNGGVLSQAGPTFIATQGWDWIPAIRDRDMGIWQDVSLTALGAVRLENLNVVSILPLPRTDSADLTVEATARNVSDQPATGRLRGVSDGWEFSYPVTLQPREARLLRLTPAEVPALHLAHPRLWWPNGYGEPNLYSLRLSFEMADGESDARQLHFGVRQVTYQLPGSDNLAISINGVPVMCRGGDWGMDEAMKRSPRPRLEAQIRFHRLANCNMIRNWVGQSTSEDFYDLCDRYGLMVWDEFFEPNPSDSGRIDRNDGRHDVDDVPLYLANVREKVLRFRSHPSIVLWCGRNEGEPEPAAVAAGLQQIMAELETARLYHPNSNDGHGVRSGGPYAWRTPREFFLPRAERGSTALPDPARLEPFKTELGSVSIPTLEAIEAMLPAKDWDSINDDWAEHDLCRGAQAGDRYPAMLTERYGAWRNLAGFVRRAQLANYEAYRAMFEGRFARLFHPCTGVLTWMSNPAQPSFVWQLYSYDLEPHASLFAVRKAGEPLHVQLNQNDFHVAIINQLPAVVAGLTVRIRVVDLGGAVRLDRSVRVTASGSAATDVGPVPFSSDLTGVHFVKLELRDSAGRLVSDNFYWRGVPSAPDDFRALTELPIATLDAELVRHDGAGQCRLDLTLSNHTSIVAVMAHAQLRRGRTNERVLPVFASDNYVSLLPGESRTITVEAAANDLRGEPPLIAIDGWNVTVRSRSYPGAAVAANAAAGTDAD